MLRSMEKLRIGFYGMTQVAAIVYGVLAAGAVVKAFHPPPSPGDIEPAIYNGGMFYRDYGFYLLLLVVAWAVYTAYFASSRGGNKVDEDAIMSSGLSLTIGFALLGTFLAFQGTFPQHVLIGHP